jgi:hypothetical protein
MGWTVCGSRPVAETARKRARPPPPRASASQQEPPLARTRASASGADTPGSAAVVTAEELAALCEHLQELRLKELRQRARLIGVGEQAIDEAENSEQPKNALASLIAAEVKKLDNVVEGAETPVCADSAFRLVTGSANYIHDEEQHSDSADGGSPPIRLLRSRAGDATHAAATTDWPVQHAVARGGEGVVNIDNGSDDDDVCVFQSLDAFDMEPVLATARADAENVAPTSDPDPDDDQLGNIARDDCALVTSVDIPAVEPGARARARTRAKRSSSNRSSWACASRSRGSDGHLVPPPAAAPAGSQSTEISRRSSGLARWRPNGSKSFTASQSVSASKKRLTPLARHEDNVPTAWALIGKLGGLKVSDSIAEILDRPLAQQNNSGDDGSNDTLCNSPRCSAEGLTQQPEPEPEPEPEREQMVLPTVLPTQAADTGMESWQEADAPPQLEATAATEVAEAAAATTTTAAEAAAAAGVLAEAETQAARVEESSGISGVELRNRATAEHVVRPRAPSGPAAVRSPPVSPSPEEPQPSRLGLCSRPPLPPAAPPSTRLYKGWGLRQSIRVLHDITGDLDANPPQLAAREGDEITLTSREPGNGWWTAVAKESQRCGVVPASYCAVVD